jgi:hypothetical protein
VQPPFKVDVGEVLQPLMNHTFGARAVRGWLEPWVMLWCYWRVFCDLPPPTELRALDATLEN